MGTGPYRFVSWTPGVEVVLEANPDYWGGKPSVARVVYRPIIEDQARLAELEAGNLDFIVGVPPDDGARLKESPDIKVLEQPGMHVWYLVMNNQPPPTSTPVFATVETGWEGVPLGTQAPSVTEQSFREPQPVSAAGYWGPGLTRLLQDRAAVAGGVFLLLVALVSALAPYLSPYDPTAVDILNRLKPVGTAGHPGWREIRSGRCRKASAP